MKKYALTAGAIVACSALSLYGQVALAAHAVSAEPRSQQCYHLHGEVSKLSLEEIRKLAHDAYIWALAPEFVYRFLNYNVLKTAPVNKLAGGTDVAAWNNAATNAGDASVLYLNAVINLSGKPTEGGATELMLTVPASQAPTYYVVNFLDQYINTIGSIGTRTTPTADPQTTYLIAGPQSPYQHHRHVEIGGKKIPVLPSATNLNWMLIRVRADTLAPQSSPNVFPPYSTANVFSQTVKGFALNTLEQYQKNDNQPVFESLQYTFTKEQEKRAQRWQTQPTNAVDFFKQAGCSLAISPLPPRDAGLGATPLAALPAYVPPQADAPAHGLYENPAFGQQKTLDAFRGLGLTASGYAVPRNWGPTELQALQEGLERGKLELSRKLNAQPEQALAFWKYDTNAGTYKNNFEEDGENGNGYVLRGAIVLAGGSANLAIDAVYTQSNGIGQSPIQLNGRNTYQVTFAKPATPPANPSVGTIPPLVVDGNNNPFGFWSMHVYQPDNSESAAPFLMQTASLNMAYSSANLDVLSVDPDSDTITVANTSYSSMKASSPVFFGGSETLVQSWGLKTGTPYYIVADPTVGMNGQTLTFQVSEKWRQCLSSNNVPIQFSGAAVADKIANLTSGNAFTPGSGAFQWGPIQSVSQLGSQQITSNLLKQNTDGSYTIWVGPKLPNVPGADARNWIPTPNEEYYSTIYDNNTPVPASCPDNPVNARVNTEIRLMIRMYFPTPGCSPPSIMPCQTGDPGTYVLPLVEHVQ